MCTEAHQQHEHYLQLTLPGRLFSTHISVSNLYFSKGIHHSTQNCPEIRLLVLPDQQTLDRCSVISKHIHIDPLSQNTNLCYCINVLQIFSSKRTSIQTCYFFKSTNISDVFICSKIYPSRPSNPKYYLHLLYHCMRSILGLPKCT